MIVLDYVEPPRDLHDADGYVPRHRRKVLSYERASDPQPSAFCARVVDPETGAPRETEDVCGGRHPWWTPPEDLAHELRKAVRAASIAADRERVRAVRAADEDRPVGERRPRDSELGVLLGPVTPPRPPEVDETRLYQDHLRSRRGERRTTRGMIGGG